VAAFSQGGSGSIPRECVPTTKEFVCGQGQQHITRQHGKERARVQYDGKSIIGHHLKIVPADVLTSPDELVQCTASLDLHSLLVGQNVLHQDTPMTSHLA